MKEAEAEAEAEAVQLRRSYLAMSEFGDEKNPLILSFSRSLILIRSLSPRSVRRITLLYNTLARYVRYKSHPTWKDCNSVGFQKYCFVR